MPQSRADGGQRINPNARARCTMNADTARADAPATPTADDWSDALLKHDDQFVHAARLAALGEIAAGIAHEINQPLAAIQMIVTSLLADIERGQLPTGRTHEWLNTINEQIGRISWIIGHLRSFTRNEEPEPQASAALGEIIQNTLGLLSAQLRSHGIAIELDIQEPLPQVRGDARRLEQVLVNLLSNARDAFDTLPPEARRLVRIRAQARPEQDGVLLEVADSGPGMPEAVRERIFEPFFTTKGAGKGTGLGLAIVRTIVHDSEGHITVESRPGAGTTFRIELPTAPPRAEAAGEAGR
jgi:C4-dicarboxylate-specific signal transduction histidine kinase